MIPAPTTEKLHSRPLNQAEIEMLAPAKLNLLLKITGQRADGYHEVVSVLVPVELYDKLTIGRLEKGLEVYWSGRELPEGKPNLVHRAAYSFFEKSGIRKGARIRVVKKIPISSGLGGGSSDAAATLLGLNQLWGNPLSRGDVEELARTLGADVPFFLLQRPCIARGIGEILQPIEDFPLFWYVIISPHLMVSTAWAYKNIKLQLTGSYNQSNLKKVEESIFNIPDSLSNDLESATLRKYPFLGPLKASLTKLGARSASMTGSGPSLFGLFDSAEKAKEAGAIMVRQWRDADIFVVKGLG
jgi:4-diphosphocytidyl-2-C-methyl-D-erythritol kinase